MIQPDENQIASRSYLIWEKEGRPDGRALDHWLQAKFELEAEAANGGKPKRARAAAPRKPNGTTGTRKAKARPV
jgi:hypothetical protein